VKKSHSPNVVADLAQIFSGCKPEIVYLHNPADKHDTHVAVFLRCLEALRSLPADTRPSRVLGCEVWRDLDWLVDSDKAALDAGRHPELAEALLKVFDSQVTGGKRYDLATTGRYRAHATYHQPLGLDATVALTFAMDLTPLVESDTLDPLAYAKGYIERFGAEVADRVRRLS
jgi:LmbE family N-acetylglucosaminyl deacetylase